MFLLEFDYALHKYYTKSNYVIIKNQIWVRGAVDSADENVD